MSRLYSERGDTLVEVLMAMAVLSIVVVGAFSLMNRGGSLVQASLERSQVRNEINGQLELLQFYRDQYASKANPTVWQAILGRSEALRANTDCTPNAKPYSLLYDGSAHYGVTPFPAASAIASTLPAPGNGLWVESVNGGGASVKYVDFIVKACWASVAPVGDQTTDITSSTLRLYYE